jgi:hypothetical protein
LLFDSVPRVFSFRQEQFRKGREEAIQTETSQDKQR